MISPFLRKSAFGPGILLLAFILGVLLTSGSVGHCQKPLLIADDLFQTNSLIEIEIRIPEKDWSALTGQTRDFRSMFQGGTANPFTNFKASITVNGVKIDSVAIRKKGFIGSLDNYRPSLKIKFDEYVDQAPIDGLDRLTLNNNKQDRSLVSQHLTYELFRRAGLKAPRTSFARVTVNGEYLGIYTHVESIRKPFLNNGFGDGSGALFEGTIADLYPKAIERIEAKNKKAKDLKKPRELAQLLAAEGELDLARVAELVDVPYFLKFLAMETLIGFWDGYAQNQNNYYMYEAPSNDKIYFIPWGADGALDSERGRLRQMAEIDRTAVYANGMLANRLFWAGNTKEEYVEVMEALLNHVWKEDELIAEIDRLEELFSPELPEFQSRYQESLDQVRAFVFGRRDQINGILASGWDNVPKTPRKPMYTVPVGTATGSFATVWSDELGQTVGGGGSLKLKLILNDEIVEFSDMSADAGPIAFRGFGRRGGGRPGGRQGEPPPAPVSIRLTGRRQSDNEPITLSLTIDRQQFSNSNGREIEVTGFLQQGQGGFGRRGGGMRSIGGKITLNAAGMKAGEKVSGNVDLNIVETRGGMFNRR